MASMATIASAVMLLLTVATAAVSTKANKASPLPTATSSVSPPKLPSKSPNLLASVSPPKPPASATCVTSLLDLSPCLSFFKDASATSAPPGCCDGLRTIIGAQALCLCHIMNHSLERAIGVDIPIDRAFNLLGNICSLALPPEVLTSCGNKDRVPPLYVCPVPSA